MSALTSEQIRQKIKKLQANKDEIQRQVDEAKRRARAEGIYADAQWMTSAEHALRITGRKIGELQTMLGEARKAERKASDAEGQRFERIFMIKSREILPRSLYEQIMSEATEALQTNKSPVEVAA